MHFSRAVVSLTVIIWHKRIGEREEKDVNFVDVCISNASFAKLLYLLRVFFITFFYAYIMNLNAAPIHSVVI